MKTIKKLIFVLVALALIAGFYSCEKEVEVQVPGPERVVEKKVKPSDFDSTWELVDRKEKKSVKEYESDNGEMVTETTITYTDTYKKTTTPIFPDGSKGETYTETKTITHDGPVTIEVQTGGEITNPDTGKVELVDLEYKFSAFIHEGRVYASWFLFGEGVQYVSNPRLDEFATLGYYYDTGDDVIPQEEMRIDLNKFTLKKFPFQAAGAYPDGYVYSWSAPIPSHLLAEDIVINIFVTRRIVYEFDGNEKETLYLSNYTQYYDPVANAVLDQIVN